MNEQSLNSKQIINYLKEVYFLLACICDNWLEWYNPGIDLSQENKDAYPDFLPSFNRFVYDFEQWLKKNNLKTNCDKKYLNDLQELKLHTTYLVNKMYKLGKQWDYFKGERFIEEYSLSYPKYLPSLKKLSQHLGRWFVTINLVNYGDIYIISKKFLKEEAKKCVKRNWGIRDFKVPIVINKRLRTTEARYITPPKEIQFAQYTIDQYSKKEVVNILKHELCHWFLEEQGITEYHHHGECFKRELKKILKN
ncbi:MAG: SprT-like domain-containing protein [bacterium]